MKIKWAIAFIFLSFSLVAQKELTLSDAVMQQYRQFYPEHIVGFSWIPSSTEYSFLDKYTKLVKGSVGKKDTKEIINIQQLNEKAGVDFSYFSNFTWFSKNEFTVNDGQSFVLYNIATNTAKSWQIEGENALMSWKKKAIAYTVDNNVFLEYSGGNVAI